MLENFLISIGLKQPNSIETYSDDPVSTVRPSSENRFTSEEYSGDVKVHEPKDEVEIKVLKTFSEIHKLGVAIKDEYIVAMDIRDIEDQTERRRILDFVTGMAFVSNSTIRSINRDGVFLILPSNSSLPTNERESLQDLGLYNPIGQLNKVLDSFFDQLLAPIRNMIPTLRIGMAGLDLSPIILILGLNYLVLPILSRMVC